MNPSSILTQRLTEQGLIHSSFATPHDVVQTLGAVQAQDYSSAKWALSLRMKKKGVVDADIEEAMNKGAILRTHVMRPTWHFVSPADIRWMLALTGERVKRHMGYYNRILKLDEKTFAKTNRLITDALRGENFLTRKELDEVLKKGGYVTNIQKRAHIVSNAELDGLICSGPRKGKQFTYALIEERAPKATVLSRDESLRELAARYFASHGPATVADFVWWSGLTTGEARKGIEKAKLKSETVNGHTYWFSSLQTKQPDISDTFFLLPNYDEYTIAYKTSRPLLFAPRPQPPTSPRGAEPFSHVMVHGGRIIGMWKRTMHGKHIAITLRPYTPMSRSIRSLAEEAADEYGLFFGLPTRVQIV